MTVGIRRPGGNWSLSRIDKAEHYQTVLYEIDMLRFAFSKLIVPPESAQNADVWAYLESFLIHYRNLLDFFGKDTRFSTDLTIQNPEMIWSAQSGTSDRLPPKEIIEKMQSVGKKLWKDYEDGANREDTISRYLQHCTTYRLSPKRWYPVEMMHQIKELLSMFESHLPEFTPARHSGAVDRKHFFGGASISTNS
jgi:hypothetical protein